MAPTGSEASHLRSAIKECGDLNQVSSNTEEENCADVFGKSTPVAHDKCKTDEAENILTNPELIKQEEELRLKNEKLDQAEEAKFTPEEDDLNPHQRYKKLCDLLSKSKFYSNFLLQKMEREDEESKNLKSKNLAGRKAVNGNAKEKFQNGNESKKRGRSKKIEELPSKKIKYEFTRTCDGKPIPDDQPLLLSGGIMRDYQLLGYQWMATLYENGINGILADEMGLGKTIQTIALFAHLVEMGVPGPFLVIAPLSTIANWKREFNKFAPLMPVVLYHGSAKEREALRNAHVKEMHQLNEEAGLEGGRKVRNTFITSYEIAMNDQPAFRKVKWLYIVVDEGHRLKNMHCRLIKSLKLYNSSNRLLLTGTPLQNNLDELWSLLNFLMSEIFDDLRVFRSWFDAKDMHHDEDESGRILRQEQQHSILSTLHQILTPFLLRRVKADVDLNIPPKKEVLVYCPLTAKQKEMYSATVNHTIASLLGEKKKEEEVTGPRAAASMNVGHFLDTASDGPVAFERYCEKMRALQNQVDAKERSALSFNAYNEEYRRKDVDLCYSIKSRMMDMRKTCNHPYLLEYPLTEDGNFYRSDEDMVDICGKLKVLDQMIHELTERGHKILVFSQMTRMLDILGDYLHYREIQFSRLDGSMHFEDRQANIDRFSNDPAYSVFLLSTRAGGLGINLTAADTVIIYDSDWNPQQDLQAQDRAHRIGQTKPVMIYRLVTANTIDEKIVERAASKRKLEKMIIHRNKFKSQDTDGLKTTMQAITPQELLELLVSKDHSGVVDRADEPVFTKEELDLLLDRSDLTWEKINQKQKAEYINKKKQTESFGYTTLPTDEGHNTGDAQLKDTSKTRHFKVIDTEGLPQGLKSVKEDN